jgi:hypothetical protein
VLHSFSGMTAFVCATRGVQYASAVRRSAGERTIPGYAILLTVK